MTAHPQAGGFSLAQWLSIFWHGGRLYPRSPPPCSPPAQPRRSSSPGCTALPRHSAFTGGCTRGETPARGGQPRDPSGQR